MRVHDLGVPFQLDLADVAGSSARLGTPGLGAVCESLQPADLSAGACRAGLQESDAADICQDVFRAVAGNLERFRYDRPSDTFRGWLWTITRNKIRDFCRAQANRPGAMGGTVAQQRMHEVPDLPEDVDEASGFR